MVWKCLQKQTFPREDWEWIVGSKFSYDKADKWVKDPPKGKDNFYALNRSYNAMLRVASGDVIISCQDGIWTDSNMLQHFWDLYQDNPRSCVGAVGDQYEKLDEFCKPTVVCWVDPRRTDKHGEYYEINPIDLEFTLCSVPRQAFYDVGGFSEDFDLGAAVGEKELCLRMDKAGYKFYIDQGLNYLALHHHRLTEDWDKYYDISCKLLEEYRPLIQIGERLKLNYL
jgi:hypothetical protein